MRNFVILLLCCGVLFCTSCDRAVQKIVREVGEEVAEKGTRELSQEAVEHGVKEAAEGALKSQAKNSLRRAITRSLITSKNQFISGRTYLQWIENPQNYRSLILGAPKKGEILRENMKKVMGKNYKYAAKGHNQAHHIVGDNPESVIAKRVLTKFGIDINDPINGILLPDNVLANLKGTVHRGGHTKEYFNTINNRLLVAKSREHCIEILDHIKHDLYEGKLMLYGESKHQVNKVLNSI